MADTTQTYAFPLATYTGSPTDGGGSDVDNVGGASGTSSGQGGTISRGAMIAIIVVVVFVAVFGITSSVLFYLAKKREWKVRETIRRSARKVVTALTPRRSEFPKSVKDRPSTSRGRVRLDDVPPTPRLPVDLEKGLNKSSKPTNMKSKFANLTRK